MAVVKTELDLPLVGRGKVRDVYLVPSIPDTLLFVATDRISAFDVVLRNGIPDKGCLLTRISRFWFDYLADVCPNHLTEHAVDECLPGTVAAQVRERSMVVRKLNVVPIESIVRGYLTGSGWKEYQSKGTVHGIVLPEGLQESQALDQPLWTPSTKAEQGDHDENISPGQARELIGQKLAQQIEQASLKLYKKGILIADTKFEFGIDPATGQLVLGDEVLTPDSSRFWRADRYAPGKPQESYDKQYLRNFLAAEHISGQANTTIPEHVVQKTRQKYIEAYEALTGQKWS